MPTGEDNLSRIILIDFGQQFTNYTFTAVVAIALRLSQNLIRVFLHCVALPATGHLYLFVDHLPARGTIITPANDAVLLAGVTAVKLSTR